MYSSELSDPLITSSGNSAVLPEASEVAPEPRPVHWTPLTRVGFRIAFLYFFCFLFLYGNGSLLALIPFVGNWITDKMSWPLNHLSEWAAVHVFHVTGVGAHFHPTGSGDTAVQWVQQLVFICFAVVGGLVWTAISAARGNRRAEYSVLYAWLRFLLRLTTAFFMFLYGLSKLFPMQMAPISIAVLNEPVGQMSPMTMLWSMLALHPVYEMICGAAEVIGGILLLFRRTALAGALVSAFVMTNVLLYNIFFDVPVKLFAANLLLALLFIVLPDVVPLYNFFWRHQPAAPVGVWIPPVKRRGFRIATRTVEIVYTVVFLVIGPAIMGYQWHRSQVEANKPTPLLGAWHLDAAHPASGAMITGEGLPATDFYVDSATRAFRRSTDLALWRTGLNIDGAAHTIDIRPFPGEYVVYSWQMPDNDHLVLTSTPPKTDGKGKGAPSKTPFRPEVMTFTRTPIPSSYPLLTRGFHWINEWGLER